MLPVQHKTVLTLTIVGAAEETTDANAAPLFQPPDAFLQRFSGNHDLEGTRCFTRVSRFLLHRMVLQAK